MATILLEEILERGDIDTRLRLLSLRIIDICDDLYSNTYILTVISKDGLIRHNVRIPRMELITAFSPIDMILRKIADCFSTEEGLYPPVERHKAIKSKVRRRIRS